MVDRLLRNYQSKDLIAPKTKEADIRGKIKEVIAQNFHEEEAIEEEARRMLVSHAGQVKQVKEMDHFKMFVLIKQKLAQKRGFIL